MIRGIKKEAVPYVLEDDRANDPKNQTIFWIKPKRAHESNQTIKRYGGAARDARGGYKDFNVKKLDTADVEEFISTVTKVENYGFAEDSDYFKNYPEGILKSTGDKELLAAVAMDIGSAYLNEIFDVSNDNLKLEAGRHLVKKSK